MIAIHVACTNRWGETVSLDQQLEATGGFAALKTAAYGRLCELGARLQASFEAGHKVLVVAPTRELAVQLANEAAGLCTREDAVQIVAIGCAPQPAALLEASVICCTAAEFMALGVRGGSTMTGSNKDSPFQGVIEAVLANVRVLVLDELDSLLPVHNVYAGNKQRAGAKKKAESKKYLEADAQALLPSTP